MRVWSYILMLFLFPWLCNSASASQSCFTVAFTNQEGYASKYMMHVVRVYNDAGLCVKFVQLPFGRALHMAKNDQIDAIFARSFVHPDTYLGLHPVPEKLMSVNAYFIGREEVSGKIKRLEDLRGLRLASLDGSDWSDGFISELDFMTIDVKEEWQLIEMYKKGRIDGFLVNEVYYEMLMRKDSRITALIDGLSLSEPLISLPVHHWVANKNTEIIPLLSASIKKSKAQY